MTDKFSIGIVVKHKILTYPRVMVEEVVGEKYRCKYVNNNGDEKFVFFVEDEIKLDEAVYGDPMLETIDK